MKIYPIVCSTINFPNSYAVFSWVSQCIKCINWYDTWISTYKVLRNLWHKLLWERIKIGLCDSESYKWSRLAVGSLVAIWLLKLNSPLWDSLQTGESWSFPLPHIFLPLSAPWQPWSPFPYQEDCVGFQTSLSFLLSFPFVSGILSKINIWKQVLESGTLDYLAMLTQLKKIKNKK